MATVFKEQFNQSCWSQQPLPASSRSTWRIVKMGFHQAVSNTSGSSVQHGDHRGFNQKITGPAMRCQQARSGTGDHVKDGVKSK
jgi:hypothetical protein